MHTLAKEQSILDAAMPPPRDSIRALLIDDDIADTFLVRSLSLKSKQMDLFLTTRRTIEDAKVALTEGHFDVLYVDYWLGDETSISFIHDVSHVHKIPCILLTGLDTPDIRRCAFRAGVVGFLSKYDLSIQAIESVTLTVLRQSGRFS